VIQVMNLRVPQNGGKLSSGYATGDLESSAQLLGVVLDLKNGVFWDVKLFGSCKNRRIGGI
jgi:hypothetical protein